MLREIIFRGKRADNGEWVEGVYYKQTQYYGEIYERHCIIISTEDLSFDQDLEFYEVDPKTVGQYTGLTDKNGKKIFEGDICKHRSNYSGNFVISIVTYTDGHFLSMADNNSGFNLSDNLEIIGNIHDNPELLKGEPQ